MATHVALLRGINVGGRNKLPMTDLRRIVESLGHTGVVTYIQSGNVVFTASEPAGDLAGDLAEAITAETGLRVGVVVLSRAELDQVIRDNPYPGDLNPKFVHAVFLPAPPGPSAEAEIAQIVERAAQAGGRGDTAQLVGRTLFLHTPAGLGRSKLAELLLSRAASPVANGTARNWSTVTKLLALCDR
jgi:uncharacterized protein (DUF1697 family)